jgi:hypothetical protein
MVGSLSSIPGALDGIRWKLEKPTTTAQSAPALGTVAQQAVCNKKNDQFLLRRPQVKGTGLANRCPEVAEQNAGGVIKFDSDKQYKLTELCLEPKSWQIEEEVTKRRGETKKGKHAQGACDARTFVQTSMTEVSKV